MSFLDYFGRYAPSAWFESGLTMRDSLESVLEEAPQAYRAVKASVVLATSVAVMAGVATPVNAATATPVEVHRAAHTLGKSAETAAPVEELVPPGHFGKVISMIERAEKKSAKSPKDFVEFDPLY
jgi:hypothetical protein